MRKSLFQIVLILSFITACSKMSTTGSLTSDVIGNGSTGLRIEDLPEADSGLPTLERGLLAHKIAEIPNIKEVKGVWIGTYYSRGTDGHDSRTNYLFELSQSENPFETIPVVGRVAVKGLDLNLSSTNQISQGLREALSNKANDLNFSRAELTKNGLEVINQFSTYKVISPQLSEFAEPANYKLTLKKYKKGLIATFSMAAGGDCKPYLANDLWIPEANAASMNSQTNQGPGVEGACGVWILFRKLD